MCSSSSGAQGVGGYSSVCWDATPGESHSGLPPAECRSLAGGERDVDLLSVLVLPSLIPSMPMGLSVLFSGQSDH